jgi:hypothetical protein
MVQDVECYSRKIKGKLALKGEEAISRSVEEAASFAESQVLV